MNSRLFKDALYETRDITDLRDLMNSSTEIFGDRAVYLVKDRPGGNYQPISYRQFRGEVTALGTSLISLGLKDKKVALIGENRYEWIVSYLAVVCGVGVIVPIDRELSAEETANLMKRSGVSGIIYSGKLEKTVAQAIDILGGIDVRISLDVPENDDVKFSYTKLMEEGRTLLAEGHREYFNAVIEPDQLSSLLFTSGTTGLAKGVMLSHKNIVSNCINMSKYVHVEGQIALSVLPMHHTFEFDCLLMTAMYQGCTVAICEGLKYVVKNMAESKASVMVAVPLMFEKIHQRIWKQAAATGKADTMRKAIAVSKAVGGQNIRAVKRVFKDVHQAMGGNMRLLVAGGAAIDPTVVSDFCAMGINMIQGYGMTENAPIIALNKDRYSKPAAAGLPMPGTEVKIIEPDENGIGEILCKGPSVMIGYYEDPEETAKILKDGWLYTGDYGYIDSDGFVYITGRKKNVIVTKGGKNIYPEEVEYYLLKSPLISEVVVFGYEDEKSGDTYIFADIFPDQEYVRENFGNISEDELRKLLDADIDKENKKMPPYKRVRRFVLRDKEFEKTTTQKIKRHTVRHIDGPLS